MKAIENISQIKEFIKEIKELAQDPIGKIILEQEKIYYNPSNSIEVEVVKENNAKPGDYLYSDMTWSTELIEGKVVVGVCVKARGEIDNRARFISIVNMSLKTPETGTIETGNDLVKNSGAGIRWGKEELVNTISINNGFYNTQKILKKVQATHRPLLISMPNRSDYYPAAYSCFWFNAGVGSLSGKWYLPAIKELENIDIDFINEKLMPLVDKRLAVYIGSTTFPTDTFGSELWSSTEYNERYSYIFNTYFKRSEGGGNLKVLDYHSRRVRAMIAI